MSDAPRASTGDRDGQARTDPAAAPTASEGSPVVGSSAILAPSAPVARPARADTPPVDAMPAAGERPAPSAPVAAPAPGASAPLRVGVVILAAGSSSRMGTPKQLLPWRGEPLLVHAVRAALASPAWPVVVVLGAEAEKIRPALARLPVIVAENSAWSEGMAASIRTGIATLRQFSRALDGAIIALCDQPAFSVEAIGRLIAAHETTGCGIAAARYGGHLGAPAFFTREHFPALAALTGEEGARALLHDDPTRVAPVDLPGLALDLDTPADYAALAQNPP